MHGPHPPPPAHPPPPHEKPKPPGEHRRARGIIAGVFIATLVAVLLGFALYLYGISINVILPVLAPIWVGILSLTYIHMSHK